MSGTESYVPDGWDGHLAELLPQLRRDHSDARASYERVISVVVLERQKGHASVTMAELELVATIASLDYELKTLLLRLLEAPSERAVWHKYLALVVWQVLVELPRQLGSGLQTEGKRFKDAVKGIRSDRAFMDELARIRNAVAAHLGVTDDGPGRLEWSFESIVSDVQGAPAVLTRLAVDAMTVSAAVHDLGSSLIRRHVATFPGANV